MVIASILIGALIAGLVLIYLTRPNYDELELSAARFFAEFTSQNESALQFSLKSLLLSRAFYLQLMVFLGLLLALLLTQCSRTAMAEQEGIGVWVVLDTSNSMSTIQNGDSRWAAALAEIDTLQSHLEALNSDIARCTKLSTFDLAIKEQPAGVHLNDAVAGIAPRTVGTDLGNIRQLMAALEEEDETCAITHIVVISDMPAPDWLTEAAADTPFIWRDVSIPVGNVGITAIQGGGGDLLGTSSAINVEVTAFHEVPDNIILRVSDESGAVIKEESFTLQQPGIVRGSFLPEKSGLYTIEVQPGGNFSGDDLATIAVDVTQQIRVDWQLEDSSLREQLGWQEDSVNPHLRVRAAESPIKLDNSVPELLIGKGYQPEGRAAEIDYFDDDSPLLADVNLDVLERMSVTGLDLAPDSPLQHVLYDTNETVWLATGREQLAAYVPDLPVEFEEEELTAVFQLFFFNAARYLLQGRRPEPLYTLTSDSEPQPEGNRIALHPGEGNTARIPHSLGELADIRPVLNNEDEEPVWPLFLAVAACLFLIERILSLYGGPKWR